MNFVDIMICFFTLLLAIIGFLVYRHFKFWYKEQVGYHIRVNGRYPYPSRKYGLQYSKCGRSNYIAKRNALVTTCWVGDHKGVNRSKFHTLTVF